MYSQYNSRSHQTSNDPSSLRNHQSQQQYTNAYQYTQGYQTLGPPTLNTSYSSNGHYMDRSPSHGSSDSGYFTRAPSVASPTPQQNYPIPSYPAQSYLAQSYPTQSYPSQNYPVQGYAPSRQPSQQGANYSYDNSRGHSIEVIRGPTISSSRQKKDRRLSTPSPSSPSEYPCLHPNCGHISSRAHDLKRHMTVHFPPPVEELLNCQYAWCGRTGAHGFKREDHRKEHYRKVHMKESEYPKTGKGGRSGRSGGSGGRSKS